MVVFSSVQMLAMLPLFLIHKEVPKAYLKSFILSEEKKLFKEYFE